MPVRGWVGRIAIIALQGKTRRLWLPTLRLQRVRGKLGWRFIIYGCKYREAFI